MITANLEQQIQQCLDGELSESEKQALFLELKGDPQAMKLYCLTAAMDASLTRLAHGQLSLNTASESFADLANKTQTRRMFRIAVLAAAAVLLLGLITMRMFFVDTTRPPALAFQTAPGTQFTLTHSGRDEVPTGMVLENGSRLQLSQGTVELAFASGVKSIIMAPADLTLHDDNALYMNQGTAWFHVPKGAEGFQVKTKDLNIVDLGTEFGVLAKLDNHDEIHVIKGKVQVTANRVRKESTVLIAGNACRIDPVGRLNIISVKSSAFITSLPKSLPYIHWSFDHIDDGFFKAEGNHPELEQAAATPSKVDIQTLVTKGVYGSAVRFTGIKGQQLHTQLPGVEGDFPRTTACWVRSTYEPSHENGGGDIAGIIGWGYCIDDSKEIRTNMIWKQYIGHSGIMAVRGGDFHKGQTRITDGKWHHLACVMTPSKEAGASVQVTLYVDGKIDRSISVDPSQRPNTAIHYPDSTSVRIGCSIHKPNTDPIVFKGEIDEVYLFYGALDETSILNLMRKNHPFR